VWLLVCNSRGINVWCAAGGGHFTDHDVVAAIRASRLADHVDHDRLVLPQLAATGIEPRHIERATGFSCRWGPARLEDLPAFLDKGCKVTREQRKMTFPLWERLEMALMWAAPMSVIALVVCWLIVSPLLAVVASAMVLVQVFSIFALLPHLPVMGAKRWLTYSIAALLGSAAAVAIAGALGMASGAALITLAVVACVAMGVLSVDLSGTTPWYPSTINSFDNHFDVELIEERCTGAAICVQVCPRDVLAMNGKRRKVELRRPDACIRCGACIVQCPEDALQFRFEDGRTIDPQTVRTTRLNMLGRRAVSVSSPTEGRTRP
jgi:NAD-dependent dihydropyrimidine dehydrogenase PreA subunit